MSKHLFTTDYIIFDNTYNNYSTAKSILIYKTALNLHTNCIMLRKTTLSKDCTLFYLIQYPTVKSE